MTLSPLVEYLLALPHPKGGTGKLCQLGVGLIQIPVFPPGFVFRGEYYPVPGSYCLIEFMWKQSTTMVPGAFYARHTHTGLNISDGLISSLTLSEGWNLWAELTRGNPGYFTYMNISPVAQYFETLNMFLIINNEEDYNLVHQIVSEWRRGGPGK